MYQENKDEQRGENATYKWGMRQAETDKILTKDRDRETKAETEDETDDQGDMQRETEWRQKQK